MFPIFSNQLSLMQQETNHWNKISYAQNVSLSQFSSDRVKRKKTVYNLYENSKDIPTCYMKLFSAILYRPSNELLQSISHLIFFVHISFSKTTDTGKSGNSRKRLPTAT